MRFGLIGHPVAHSFSPAYFKEKFIQLQLQCTYDVLDIVHLEGIRTAIDELNWMGFNVTIPHKLTIIPFLDDMDASAEAIGAVNTVLISANGWKGYNTDHLGFGQALDSIRSKKDESALILGDGGSAKAVKFALEQRGIPFQVVSRLGQLNYDALHPSIIRKHPLIINTTPLGMSPNTSDCPDIPYEALTSDHLLFDLIYHPEETLFLKRGKLLGTRTINGLDMLKLQADASWNIWRSHHLK